MSLFERVAAEQDRHLAERREDLETVRRDLLSAARRARQPGRRARLRPWALGAAALALGAVALLFWVRHGLPAPAEPALAFHVGERAGVVGQWARASDGERKEIRFSDGSRWILESGARARVTKVRPRGADLTLEAGLAHVSVVHRPGSRWTVSAGPFQVLVTGTRFDVDWDPEADHFEVYLEEGAVTLKGCAFGEGRPLHRGERVEASCERQSFQVLSGRRAETAAPMEHPTPAVREEPVMDAPAASSARPSRPPPVPAWKTQLGKGEYRPLAKTASDADFRAACAAASSSQLSALGDAARFAGSLDRARIAYLALRERFAGTPGAATAAFRLARMDFDQRLSYRQAAKWFATYLGEQPGGPLAREALGRLVEARQRSGDQAGARAAATRYLESYPDGPHAPVARSVLGGAAED